MVALTIRRVDIVCMYWLTYWNDNGEIQKNLDIWNPYDPLKGKYVDYVAYMDEKFNCIIMDRVLRPSRIKGVYVFQMFNASYKAQLEKEIPGIHAVADLFRRIECYRLYTRILTEWDLIYNWTTLSQADKGYIISQYNMQ